MRISFCIVSCLSFILALAEEVKLSSPNGEYSILVTDNNGVHYSVDYNDKEVLGLSAFDIKWDTGGPTRPYNLSLNSMEGMEIQKVFYESCDSVWIPVYGENESIPEQYNQATIDLMSSQNLGERTRKTYLTLEIRAYNEGIAWRYKFNGNSYLRIREESSEFKFPEGTKFWFTPRAQTVYSLLSLNEWPGESERPLLAQLPDNTYVCIGEAGVVDYVRTRFIPSPKNDSTVITLMYGDVEEIAPYASPWRVIMCGEKAGQIAENNYLFLNLNRPSEIDTSWIKPGKMMRETTLTTEGAFAVIDYAKKHNISYLLFDTGWYGNEGDKESKATAVNIEPRRNSNPHAIDMEKVVEYGKKNDIGIFLYVNQRALQQDLDNIIKQFKEWGIAGIKFGFVQVGSQVWTKWMHDAVRKCGENGLLVDIHDEYRPTGVSRTYPNLMTQEGIRGNEEFPDATQNTILPFTRYVAGPADYTICYYRQDWDRLNTIPYGPAKAKSIQNTPAHQLALSVVYYSPLQVLYWYDKPSDSQNEPELKFFDDVYTVWDETKVIDGIPGEYVITARRKGDDWFIGGITNTEARNIEFNLDFVDSKKYNAEIYTDGGPSLPTRTKVNVASKTVKKNDKLSFDLMPSGGVAIKLSPIK